MPKTENKKIKILIVGGNTHADERMNQLKKELKEMVERLQKEFKHFGVSIEEASNAFKALGKISFGKVHIGRQGSRIKSQDHVPSTIKLKNFEANYLKAFKSKCFDESAPIDESFLNLFRTRNIRTKELKKMAREVRKEKRLRGPKNEIWRKHWNKKIKKKL